MYEDFNISKYDNDVALLKLKEKIVFVRNNVIAPICLPSFPLEKFYDVNVTTIGWGTTKWGIFACF